MMCDAKIMDFVYVMVGVNVSGITILSFDMVKLILIMITRPQAFN